VSAALLDRLTCELTRGGASWRRFAAEDEAQRWAEGLVRRARDQFGAAEQDETGDRETVGLTWARALIAETGSVVLTSREGAPRSDALLVRHHIVLAREQDTFPDLAAYLESLPAERLHETLGSHLTLISGPSRTADIEKVLVIPAHGPARLTVGLIGNR